MVRRVSERRMLGSLPGIENITSRPLKTSSIFHSALKGGNPRNAIEPSPDLSQVEDALAESISMCLLASSSYTSAA